MAAERPRGHGGGVRERELGGRLEFLRELPASQVAEASYITYRNLQAELGAW
jgi:hypothetical protein